MLEFVLTFIFLFLLIWWKFGVNDENLPPIIDGRLPIIGHAHKLIGNSEGLYDKLQILCKECTEKGGVIRTYIGSQLFYVITDPDDAVKAGNALIDRHYVFDFLKPWFGDGLLTASGNTWKHHRKLLNPAFSSRILFSFIDIFNNQAKKLADKLADKEGKGPFDIKSELHHSAFKTICLTAFGNTVTDDENFNKSLMHASATLMNIITKRFQYIWLQNDLIFNLFGNKKEQDESVVTLKYISGKIFQIIQRSKADLGQKQSSLAHESEPKKLLDLLIKLEEDKLLSKNEIREEIDTLTVTGTDTTTVAFKYILLILGSNQKLQDRVYEEYQKVLGDENRDVNKDDIAKLVYTNAVIKETLRIYDIAPFTYRYINKDLKLKNYTLKAGNNCAILFHGVNRHSIWGDDANEFRPERWLDPNCLPENLHAFASFGIGKRLCIGKGYSMLFMITTLAHILRRYRIVSDISNMKLEIDFLIKPVSGHLISLQPRTCSSE